MINPKLDLCNPRFPSSICSTCRQILREHEQNIQTIPFKGMLNYEDIGLPKETRSFQENEFQCNRFLCLTGKHKGHVNLKKNLPVEKTINLSTTVTRSNGLYGSEPAALIEKPMNKEKSTSKSNTMKFCRICYQELAQGKRHDCNNSTRAEDNVGKLVTSLPEIVQEQNVLF